MASPYEAALRAEAERLHERYVLEIVEALRVCPWAERSRLDGRTAKTVLTAPEPPLDEALEAARAFGDDATIEVGFLIFPAIESDRVTFERFVAELRRVDAERAGLGGPPMAMAAFHFDVEADMSSAQRLVPFLRRSPDPTVQLIRRSVLDAVRGPGDHGSTFVDPATLDLASLLSQKRRPPLHERVATSNHHMVSAMGVEAFEAKLLDIRADRDVSYAALRARFR
jgi:hypothetical protein